MYYPYKQEIAYQDPLQLFAFFSNQNGAIFLDSADLRDYSGRYSFIAVDPFFILTCKNGNDPLRLLAENLAKFSLTTYPDLPPFQGGVAGFFSYEIGHYLEKISRTSLDDMQFPDIALGFYDLVIAFDHLLQRAWIFSSGYPEQVYSARQDRAKKRCLGLQQQLRQIAVLPSPSNTVCAEKDIQSYFTSASYQAAVRKVIDYILMGDIFEANISQRFTTRLPTDLTAFDLYRRLRLLNPAPFAAYLNFNTTIIASASPERFLKVTQKHVETRPIKGTRPRGKTPLEDEKYSQALRQSAKDHAENIMIVDLLRNDLSRVCEAHSVTVPQLCGLESYRAVHHLVSVVRGKLQQGMSVIDLLRAAFPGGSITGAPKIRAMEIIAEIEPTARGPYCGSIGYIGFNGDMDSSIVIRTYAIQNNTVTFQAGGAVVADSNPLEEYEETLTKAHALRMALLRANI